MRAPVFLVAASLTVAIALTASLLIVSTRVANTSFESSATPTSKAAIEPVRPESR
jgi:hypothetical protein